MDMLTLLSRGLLLVVWLCVPVIFVAVGVGILISLLQAVMQLQDQTLPIGVKLLVVAGMLALTGRWIMMEMLQLMQTILASLPMVGR